MRSVPEVSKQIISEWAMRWPCRFARDEAHQIAFAALCGKLCENDGDRLHMAWVGFRETYRRLGRDPKTGDWENHLEEQARQWRVRPADVMPKTPCFYCADCSFEMAAPYLGGGKWELTDFVPGQAWSGKARIERLSCACFCKDPTGDHLSERLRELRSLWKDFYDLAARGEWQPEAGHKLSPCNSLPRYLRRLCAQQHQGRLRAFRRTRKLERRGVT